MKRFSQQPTPVPPQVEIPQEFPAVPQEVLDRFPQANEWQRKLNEFWTRTNQAIQQAQDQTARQANSQVVFTVDTFRINVNGVAQPMFGVDSTGVKLGDVLVVNTPGRKVYIGDGIYNNAATPFYIDTKGFFSLGDQLTWNPDTAVLSVTGTFIISGGTIGGFDIGSDYIRDTANSMGMASTVTGGDDVRFWAGDTFANRATAPFNVKESGILTATNNAVIVGTVSGRLTATLAAAINAAGNLITDVVNPRLDTGSKTILSDFNFGSTDYAGAVRSGTIAWNTTTGAITGGSGVVVYRSGIVGASAGVATFTINATTGAATFAGTLSAPSGNIGGWTINSTTLVGGNATLDSVGQLILGTVNDVVVVSAADSTYRLWIGNATAGSAAFNVTKAGVLTATGATITGSITATTGTIGGWTIGATTLTGGSATLGSTGVLTLGTSNNVVIASAVDATYRLWVGNATAASAPFRVTSGGVLTAAGATISGTITATTGAIGGCDIGTDYIRDAANSMGLASTVTGSDDVRFWAGAAFASRSTAPFRVTEAGALVATSATITGALTTGSLSSIDGTYLVALSVPTAAIAANAITTAKLAALAVTTAELAASAVTTAKIAADAVTAAEIATGAVGSTELAAGAVIAGKITAGTIVAADIAAGTITGAKIAATTITASNIAALTITAAEIAASTITAGKLSVSQLSAIAADLGTITAGAISGITIAIGSSNSIFKADSNGIYLGNATFSSAPFRVSMAGALTASSATITGTITSTSGTIGGFTIGGTTLTAGSGDSAIRLDSGTGYSSYGTSLTQTATISYIGVSVYNGNPSLLRAQLTSSGASGSGLMELSNSSGTVKVSLKGDDGSATIAGNLLVNTSSTTPGYGGDTSTGFAIEAANGTMFASRASNFCGSFNRNDDGALVLCNRSATQVGSISVTSTTTAFNTSSDKRLKTKITLSEKRTSIFDSVVVYDYEYLRDPGKRHVGFLAQELAEICPQAVTPGTDDIPWMIDHSKLVPFMFKEIQDLRERVSTLEAK